MATLTIPDQTLTRLRAAAAAKHVSVEAYLDEMAAVDADSALLRTKVQFNQSSFAERIAAADSIRRLAGEINGKVTIEELIADKQAGHKY
jgi:hypothetical protein